MPYSEIAQLRANIEQELMAMRLGLSGLAAGPPGTSLLKPKCID